MAKKRATEMFWINGTWARSAPRHPECRWYAQRQHHRDQPHPGEEPQPDVAPPDDQPGAQHDQQAQAEVLALGQRRSLVAGEEPDGLWAHEAEMPEIAEDDARRAPVRDRPDQPGQVGRTRRANHTG